MAILRSQARGLIGAVNDGLCKSHSNRDPSRIWDPHHSSWQRWVLNPLSKVRDWTRNLIVPSQIRFRCATTGTPRKLSLTVILTLYVIPLFAKHKYKHFNILECHPCSCECREGGGGGGRGPWHEEVHGLGIKPVPQQQYEPQQWQCQIHTPLSHQGTPPVLPVIEK